MSAISVTAIPDYSEQAAAELRSNSQQWFAGAQSLIDSIGEDGGIDGGITESQLDLSSRLIKTLQLLGYQSVSFGLEEVMLLLQYWMVSPPADKNEAALVLLQVAEELQSTVALPAVQARRLSALGWLTVIDNCRACRKAPAMSKDVVAAAGIALPSTSSKPMPARSDCEDFLNAIRGVHKRFARQLSAWFSQPHKTDSLADSSTNFLRLADACHSASRLSTLEPLFCAAGVVLESVGEDSTRSNIAVQRLFGRLERYLAKLGRMEYDALSSLPNLVPDDILRQLLFYVAEFPTQSSHAQKLRNDYGLHVLATTAQRTNDQRPPRAMLSEQVLAQIGFELDELRTWLSQAAADPKHKRAKQLFARLDEQYIAAGLLNFTQLQRCVDDLRAELRQLKMPVTQTQRLAVAEQILQVRERLDAPFQSSENESGNSALPTSAVDDVAVRLRQLSRRGEKNQYHATAVVACLRAVQGDLRRAESEVLALFEGTELLSAAANDIAYRLERAAIAVNIIPLPEIRPLLDGLAIEIKTHVGPDANEQYRADFAELLVALDLYLDSIVSDSRSLTPLLQHAVEALQALDGAVEDSTPDDSIHDESVDNSMAASPDTLLDAYLAANKTIAPWVNAQTNDRQMVEVTLQQLSKTAEAAGVDELSGLVSDCASYIQQTPLPADARSLVSETLSVVPQMLHAEPGVAESVRGLDALKLRLMPRLKAGDATLELVPTSAPELTQDPLDHTLNDVFVRECASHIETLRGAISVARADVPLSKLPSEKMLRSLHTLSGCTQTVEASDIVAIVQPLQKAALSLQRVGKEFTEDETDFIESLSNAMEARLHHFQHQGTIAQSVVDTERQLPEFLAKVLARSQPGNADEQTQTGKVSSWLIAKSNSVEPSTAGLSSIFRAEADDLMLSLRAHTAVLLSTENQTSNADKISARDGALKVLHTIKGSARMAGNHAMADVAHELESDVAPISDATEFGENVRQNLPRLQQTLNGSAPDDFVTEDSSNHETASVAASVHDAKSQSSPKDQTLGTLLEAGTTLVSRQAQVDDRIALVRDHVRDIQASADRLQRLAQNNPAFESVAARELVADIQAARRQLENSVQELAHNHGLASHAGTALHRSLIQSRLRTVDSLLPRLQASLNDALTVCDRDASLLLTGGDIPVSSDTLNSLAPLLEQLIRNSVAHGMSSVSVREAERKPADGEIAIAVSIDGLDLVIEVSDDGEGVDEDALNQQRQEEGLAPVQSAQHLREILCTPGYSTHDNATPVAGRGQGLGVVLDGVEALGGELVVINDPGEGLTVCLRVPQKMVVVQSLVFGEGASLHAIPVSYVTNIVSYSDESNEIQYQDQNWSLTTVEELMGVPFTQNQKDSTERCALVAVAGERIAIPLPALSGYKELLLQPLGVQLRSLERYVGGALLSDGRQALILNLHRLMQSRRATRELSLTSVAKTKRFEPLAALIADDSVTMRVAGERLLQRLGFQVHTARDGLEALDFLTRSLPAVLLLDIEMPGADGFDVVRRMRSELVAAEIPVIMISTRRGPSERERARSLGVRHLIHKPYTETELREALEDVGVLTSTSTEIG